MEQKQQGNESEPTTSLDETRNEEPWTRKGEELIREWNADIKRRVSLHDESGYYYKKMR